MGVATVNLLNTMDIQYSNVCININNSIFHFIIIKSQFKTRNIALRLMSEYGSVQTHSINTKTEDQVQIQVSISSVLPSISCEQ